MANNIKIDFISKGFRQILLSDGVKELVQSEGEKVQEKANANINEDSNGFKTTVMYGKYGGGRWIAQVQATDYAAAVAAAEDKVLIKAVK